MAKAGLVLEGGGMRGVYTAGVLDYFDEKGLFFRFIVGTSAGACNAISYVSHQRGRSFETNFRFCRDKRYINPLNVLRGKGVFGMDFMFHDIPKNLLLLDYEAYAREDCQSHAVVTCLETGKAEYPVVRDMRTDYPYVRASSSLPLFAETVEYGGRHYLDGGVADSIPIRFSQQNGNDVHIIVLTRPQGYQKKASRLSRLCARRYREYPRFVEAFANRHIDYNQSIAFAEQLERDGRAVIIRPSCLAIDKFEHNPERLRTLYLQGYRDAQAAYGSVTALIKDCQNVQTDRTPMPVPVSYTHRSTTAIK